MRRREFVGLIGGAAAWPFVGQAQQPERKRRIGVLMNLPAQATGSKERLDEFVNGLQELGWSEGRNFQIESRWGDGNLQALRKYASEFATLSLDVILAQTSPAVGALQETTRDVPIVFVQVTDPVGAGFVESLSRPGGVTTGFTNFEYGISGKWLELLRQLVPDLTRAAVIRDAGVSGIGQFGAVQSAAPSVGIEVIPVNVRDADGLERGLETVAGQRGGGLIVTSSALAVLHRELIIRLASKHQLAAVYTDRMYAIGGGLISYGPARIEQYRRAAGYVDRILKGEKPADMPVLAPTKYELVINLKTAKALGLTIPPTLLARADEVIE